MKERFLTKYSPYPQNAIDEAMIPFKGTYFVNSTEKGMYLPQFAAEASKYFNFLTCVMKSAQMHVIHVNSRYFAYTCTVDTLHIHVNVHVCPFYTHTPTCIQKKTFRQVYHEAVLAKEASQTRLQSVGEGGCRDWFLQ